MPNYFVGRDPFVEQLVERLVSGDSFALSAEGLPGVGKTTLAVSLAHHRDVLDHFKDGVLWAGLGPQPDVLSILTTWAEALDLDVSRLVTEADRAAAVKTAIGHRHLLLVIDDAWQLEVANLLRCGGPNCCHLLTTRDKGLARAFAGAAQTESVLVLEDDSAYHLLQTLAPEACVTDPAAAKALVEAVGNLPLALELLGGYLAAPERSFFPELSATALAELTDPSKRLQLAQQRLGARTGTQVTLQETILFSLDGLPELVQRAFYALGAFAPKPQWFDRAAAEAVTRTDLATLALLVARNLVERVAGEQLALHQTLADVARTGMAAEAVHRHRDYYLALVNENQEDWQRIEAVYGQIKWAWAALKEEDQLLDFVWALQLYQERRGLWHDALAWAQRGLHLAESKDWRGSCAVLFNNIGHIYSRLQQPEQALEALQQAISIWEEVGDRADLAMTLNNIGDLYVREQPEQALKYLQQAMPIWEEIGDRERLAATYHNIGGTYIHLRQPEQALEYLQQARSICEEVGNRGGLAVTFRSIGVVYFHLGQAQRALEYFEQTLPICNEMGNRYEERLVRYNIAATYKNQGRLAEAVAQLKRVVELGRLMQHPKLERDIALLDQLETELVAQADKGQADR